MGLFFVVSKWHNKLQTCVGGLLVVLFIVLALCLLCVILALSGYRLHISGKKIEILPNKESPKQKH